MSEGQPDISTEEKEQAKINESIALAREICERQESFTFPGIDAESYSNMKADQKEFPGYSTPIDDLIERFTREGMKVVLGKNPESGNIFILPGLSEDIENDSIFPRHLQTSDTMDEDLKKLILLNRK